MTLACAGLLASVTPSAAVETYHARLGQAIGCESSEAVAALTLLQRQQPPDKARIKATLSRGHCVTISGAISLIVEARVTSPAGPVGLIRGEHGGIGRLWVILDDLEMSGMSR
ncbi:MAG: hypothetical protein Q7R40_03490 [Phaeospirillum sp.]|nr:hypothetical protein [Phaeospirillum sp.]